MFIIGDMKINEWVPGTFPIPFFQTWCCKNSSITPSLSSSSSVGSDAGVDASIWSQLRDAGLPPKMYECIHDNLTLNRVGVDCIHYLFHDQDCRSFIESEYPPDVLMAYDRLIPTAFKADLWRYCVLYKYGGAYLDVKYSWGGPPPNDGSAGGPSPNDGSAGGLMNAAVNIDHRSELTAHYEGDPSPNDGSAGQLSSKSAVNIDHRSELTAHCEGVPSPNDGSASALTLRDIVERFGLTGSGGSGSGGSGGGGGCDDIFVLERDGIGLWPPRRFGIHNAFMVVKPKNPILLECICRIVSAAKQLRYARGGLDDDYSAGWITRPLFVTGPGLLGDVWRVRVGASASGGGGSGGGVGSGMIPDSYASMSSYFRFFFEGDGVIGYYNGDDSYIKLFKVYDDYHDEYRHMMCHTNCVPHYTVLWSRGLVWAADIFTSR